MTVSLYCQLDRIQNHHGNEHQGCLRDISCISLRFGTLLWASVSFYELLWAWRLGLIKKGEESWAPASLFPNCRCKQSDQSSPSSCHYTFPTRMDWTSSNCKINKTLLPEVAPGRYCITITRPVRNALCFVFYGSVLGSTPSSMPYLLNPTLTLLVSAFRTARIIYTNHHDLLTNKTETVWPWLFSLSLFLF